MSVAAAVDIASPDQDALIAAAARFAEQRGEQCFVISIVPSLPYGVENEDDLEVVERNLALITSRNASPVFQEGDDVVRTLLLVAPRFGVRTLFIQNGRRRFGRSIAEQIIHRKPSFEVVVVSRAE